MSKWTHVVGSFRYDPNQLKGRKELLSEMNYIGDMFMDAPRGSEGGLQYEVLPLLDYSQEGNVTSHSTHLCDVNISGDLRDFDEEQWQELRDWFKRVTDDKDVDVRQAVMLIENDDYPVTKQEVLTYKEATQ